MKSVSKVHANLLMEAILIQHAAQDEAPLSDQRTFDAFMNCESLSQPTFEERIRLGPLPRVSRSVLGYSISTGKLKKSTGTMGEIEPNNRPPLHSSQRVGCSETRASQRGLAQR